MQVGWLLWKDSLLFYFLLPTRLLMPIRFNCKHCGQKLSVGSQRAGTKANCPRCKEIVRVPGEVVKPSRAALAASMLVISGEGAAVETAPPSDEPPMPIFNLGMELELLGVHDGCTRPRMMGEVKLCATQL